MKSRRQQRNHETMVEEILTTARAVMREEGAAALTLHELARRLEMRLPSLYNYFAGKADLYGALFRLGFRQFDAYMLQRLAGAENWQDEIRRYMSGYITWRSRWRTPSSTSCASSAPCPASCPRRRASS